MKRVLSRFCRRWLPKMTMGFYKILMSGAQNKFSKWSKYDTFHFTVCCKRSLTNCSQKTSVTYMYICISLFCHLITLIQMWSYGILLIECTLYSKVLCIARQLDFLICLIGKKSEIFPPGEVCSHCLKPDRLHKNKQYLLFIWNILTCCCHSHFSWPSSVHHWLWAVGGFSHSHGYQHSSFDNSLSV